MMNELLINGVDASTYGVRMGKGFLDTLLAPKPLKEFVSNESRLEDGVRVVVPSSPKVASREFTLNFQITGATDAAFKTNRETFFGILYSGRLTVEVSVSDEVFKLLYVGHSPSYKGGLFGHGCKVAVKFLEPDPNDRSSS